VAFNGAILRLAMGRGSTDADPMSTEETADGTLKELAVKIAAKSFGPTAGVDEKAPESVFDGGAGEVREAVAPAVASSKIDEDQAVAVATRTGPITVANIGTDGMESAGGAREKRAMFAPFDSDEVTNRWRRLGVGGHMETSAKMGKDIVIQFSAAKETFQFGGGVTDLLGSGGFGHIL
jgi:hypothetical protein